MQIQCWKLFRTQFGCFVDKSLNNIRFSYLNQLRLEALSQMTSFLAKMEEKSDVFAVSLQSPALLQSVQLQFLSGCFALGTQIIGSHTGTQYEMQHYTVHSIIK